MALFKNAATEWEKTMTENDLDQMEAQGLDVSKYRAVSYTHLTLPTTERV